MDMTIFRSVVLLVLMIGFLGLWCWAWSRRRQSDFQEAAQLPLTDDEPAANDSAEQERKP